MAQPFFTIGHGTRDSTELCALLTQCDVRTVADVRAFPHSRRNRQFDRDAIAHALRAAGIGYVHVPALGGRRGRAHAVAPEVNALWRHRAFHNYADYALSAEFGTGLARLRALGAAQRCAVMCAEAVWWRCHRRIIADYLLAAGESVFHILGAGRVGAARLTPGACRRDAKLVYPAR